MIAVDTEDRASFKDPRVAAVPSTFIGNQSLYRSLLECAGQRYTASTFIARYDLQSLEKKSIQNKTL